MGDGETVIDRDVKHAGKRCEDREMGEGEGVGEVVEEAGWKSVGKVLGWNVMETGLDET